MSEKAIPVLEKGRILYIEDEPLLGRIFEQAFGKTGYRVTLAENGQQGLELQARTPLTSLQLITSSLIPPAWKLPKKCSQRILSCQL